MLLNLVSIQIPLIPSPSVPLQYNPADIISELEKEANVLKIIHRKITDQLTRLQVGLVGNNLICQVEEAALRRQLEGYIVKQKQDNEPEDESHVSNQFEISNLPMNLHPFNNPSQHKSITGKNKPEEDEDDLLTDDQSTVQMRQACQNVIKQCRHILETELGENYQRDMAAVAAEHNEL